MLREHRAFELSSLPASSLLNEYLPTGFRLNWANIIGSIDGLLALWLSAIYALKISNSKHQNTKKSQIPVSNGQIMGCFFFKIIE